MLSERQIDFDIVSEVALAKDLKTETGAFRTMSGNRYSTVILPGESVISEAALAHLRAFAGGGGKVLFLGHLPTMISGRTYRDARRAKPEDFAWAKVEVSTQLEATPTPPAQPPASPPPAQVLPPAIAQAVDSVVGELDVSLPDPNSSLRIMKRKLKDAEVYVLFNEGPQSIGEKAVLWGDGHRVEQWDAGTGKVERMASQTAKGGVAVKLDLKAYEMRLLVVR